MSKLNSLFAESQEEALKRHEQYREDDPFKNEIDPALLNSAHIQAYIAKTGMVFPYSPAQNPKNDKVTPASLTMTVGPEVLYWDRENRRIYNNNLTKGTKVKLNPNSITFLRPAEYFALPNYIAARFNLRIIHVHRGLLLGTGPLLDPGFKGYPMIPVHNLTENEYEIEVGEEFINVEFTKLSDIRKAIPAENNEGLKFEYIENAGKTCNYSFLRYIDKNVPTGIVKSSLSSILDQARISINEQKKFITSQEELIDKQKDKIFWTTVASIAGVVVTLGAILIAGYQLTISSADIVDDARGRIESVQEHVDKIADLERKLDEVQKSITSTQTLQEEGLNELRDEQISGVESIKEEIMAIQKELKALKPKEKQ